MEHEKVARTRIVLKSQGNLRGVFHYFIPAPCTDGDQGLYQVPWSEITQVQPQWSRVSSQPGEPALAGPPTITRKWYIISLKPIGRPIGPVGLAGRLKMA
jgi:hypothetical protein